jgi:hypothetical protein
MRFVRVIGTAAVFLFSGTVVPAFAQSAGEGEKQQAKPEAKPKATQEAKPVKPQVGPVKAAPQQQRPPQAAKAQQPAPPQQHAQQAQKAPQPTPPQQHPQQAQQPRKQQQPKVAQQPQKQQQPQKLVQQAPEQQPPQRSPQQAQAWQKQRGWQGGWKGNDTWQGDRAQRWTSDHRTWAQRGGYGGSYIPQASFNLNFGSGHFFRLTGQPVMDMGYPRFEYRGYSFLLVDPYPEYWAANWYELDDVYIAYDDGYYLCNRNYPQVQLAVIVEL